MIRSYGKLDDNRYLLSDINGTLWLLALQVDGSAVQARESGLGSGG